MGKRTLLDTLKLAKDATTKEIIRSLWREKFPEAPVDGKTYGRKNGDWSEIVAGADGLTPFIGENGNWWIGETDTGVKAQGTDGEDGDDGIPTQMSVQAGWLCWRYIGDTNWIQLYQVPVADNSVTVRIDFQSLDAFVYTCPTALKFTSQTSESTAATLSVALNTNMAQFQNLTITPTALGLVILEGVQL